MTLAIGTPALAQTTPSPSPVPKTSQPSVSSSCDQREAALGGIGRASVVSFKGAIFGEQVCATVANLAIDGFQARVTDAPSSDALVTATLTAGTGALLVAGPNGVVIAPAAGTSAVASGVSVGPFVVAPGGIFPQLGGDSAEQPRVVLAYAGQRVLVIGTTPVALVDMARILRDQPDLFGADAVERAVILASGPNAALSLASDAGLIGATSVATSRMLVITKRPSTSSG